jgi:hypothetical protein
MDLSFESGTQRALPIRRCPDIASITSVPKSVPNSADLRASQPTSGVEEWAFPTQADPGAQFSKTGVAGSPSPLCGTAPYEYADGSRAGIATARYQLSAKTSGIGFWKASRTTVRVHSLVLQIAVSTALGSTALQPPENPVEVQVLSSA